ncbi:MAG: hypothetical protein AAB403_19335, partial [Planctomycetota bacterium]
LDDSGNHVSTYAGCVIDESSGLVTFKDRMAYEALLKAKGDPKALPVTVKVWLTALPNVCAVTNLTVGCLCGPCAVAGTSEKSLGSLDTVFSMGRGPEFGYGGALRIHSTTPSASLCLPSGLAIDDPNGQLKLIRDQTNGMPRQVLSDDALADILVISNSFEQYQYSISFYTNAGTFTARSSNGLYSVEGLPAFVTWTISGAGACETINIIEMRPSVTITSTYKYADGNWSLSEGNSLRKETRVDFWDAGAATGLVTRAILTSATQTVWKQAYVYATNTTGRIVTRVVNDPDGAALTTTWSYYEDPGETNRFGKVRLVVRPDGSWTRHDYTNNGLISAEVSSFKDAATNAPDSEARATYYNYTLHSGETAGLRPYSPRTVTLKTLGVISRRTYHAYSTNS